MMSRMLTRITKTFSKIQAQLKQKKNKQMLKKMADNIQTMKITMDKTTPRAFAFLFFLSTIPSFYFINQMLENEYSSKKFKDSSQNFLKYYYLKNTVFYVTSLILFQMNFKNPSGKFAYQSRNIKFKYVPLVLGLIGILLPPSDSKHIVWPALVTDMFTLVPQLFITNCGATPFWFYSFRHFIRFFDYLSFIVLYQALKRYRERRITHSHQFTKQIQNLQPPVQEVQISE